VSEQLAPHADAVTVPDSEAGAARISAKTKPARQSARGDLDWQQTFDDELLGLVCEAHADARAHRKPESRECDDYQATSETLQQAATLRTRLTGLAFSGGGIRSASFALGAFQALLSHGIGERFHYLSTVSGGGYFGIALAWLRKRYGAEWKAQLSRRRSGARASPAHPAAVHESEQSVWLDYIRQHGNFLQPPGLGTLALAGAALRNSALSIGLYGLLLVILLVVLLLAGVLPESVAEVRAGNCRVREFGQFGPVFCIDVAGLLATTLVTIVVLIVTYSLATFILAFRGWPRWLWAALALTGFAFVLLFAMRPQDVMSESAVGVMPGRVDLLLTSALILPCATAVGFGLWLAGLQLTRRWRDAGAAGSRAYRLRLWLHRMTGTLTGLALVFAALVALPFAHRWLGSTGTVSLTALASIGALYQAFWSRTRYLPRSLTTRVRLLVTAGLVLGAATLVAYVLAVRMQSLPVWQLGAIAAMLLIVAFCTNLNQFGLNRMYRDRLMETFMPNLSGIDSTQWELATDADGREFGRLQTLWPPPSDCPERLSLYPLVNTNLVLVDSEVDTYRGRAGDSFVLAPGACGSDATHWTATRNFADRELAAATAMAASGAAANPNTGPGGRGITRNRLVSFLMFLMQARLGVWVRNPGAQRGDAAAVARAKRWLLGQRPNFLVPGVLAGLFGRGLSEDSYFLELSDGGNFDNTGVYELIRRRARIIVLVQAAQDGSSGFADLANLVEKIRVDFGVHVRFDDGVPLFDLVPPPPAHAQDLPVAPRGFAVARILYPAHQDEPRAAGWLVLLHATPIANLPVDVQSYRHHQREFPHESTGDQFFHEAQVEAYRELGYAVAKSFCTELLAQPLPVDENADRCKPGTSMADLREWLRPHEPRS